jgi:aminoglycoside phosphotransferase (APT) family kinase protein
MDVAEIEAQIDPRQALAGLGYAETSEPRRVTGGWDTLRRERLALETCARAALPAPRVETVGEVQGLPAMVLSWCPGASMLSILEKKPWTLWRLGRLFGRTQAQMHTVTPPDEFVASAPDEWASRVTHQYADLAAHASSLGLSTSSLIHTDFHPANVIIDGATVTGIIDWEVAAAGDPRTDLARTEITILAAPIPPGPLRPLLNLARSLLLRAWRAGYQELAGPIPDYALLKAWAAATFVTETEFVLDRPNVWGTEKDIDKLRRLIDRWAREAGIR